MSPNDKHIRDMIISYLERVHYWHNRFELSRDIEHLDNAERHAEVVRSYLPNSFQNLSIIALCNLYQSLHPFTVPDRPGA